MNRHHEDRGPVDGADLAWTRRHFEDAQRAAGVGSWELEVDTGRIWMSDELCRLFDVEPGSVRTVDEFAATRPPERRPIFHAALEVAIRTGTPLAYDAPVQRRDGSVRWTRGKGAVFFDAAGRLTHMIGTVEDFTELKIAQEELARKNADLEAANAALTAQAALLAAQSDELKRLDRMKDDFLSKLSHELRTPLTTIQGALSLLERHDAAGLDATAGACLRRIQLATRSLTSLVGDLLSAAQLQYGSFVLRRAPMAPGELVSDALEELAPLAEAKGVALHRSVAVGLPYVLGDPLRVAQVLRNLLHNAIRHTPEGGEVRVHVEAIGEHLRITVADTGDGLGDISRENLFGRFVPGPTGDGLGLGLFIVKELVEAHGGQVSAESLPDEGTIFTICLPLG